MGDWGYILGGLALVLLGIIVRVFIVPRSQWFAKYFYMIDDERMWRWRWVAVWIGSSVMGAILIIVGIYYLLI